MLRVTAVLATVLFSFSTASAHYLWVTIVSSAGQHGTMNLYFEGGPGPGDGKYLDPFVNHGKSWVRTLGQEKATELEMTEVKEKNKRWLTNKLTSPAPRVIESYGKWGVYRYGNTDKLLHYYAKNFDVSSLDQLEQLGTSANLKLDMRPSSSGKSLQVQVFWQGKPAANCSVSVNGPKGFKANLKTDEKGVVSFEPKGGGHYRMKTTVEEKQSGTDDGKDYQRIRHTATLLTKLPN